jgi:hypothetical protein
MAAVFALRDGSMTGPHIGFQIDTENLICRECTELYRVLYAKDHAKNLEQLRSDARRAIANEHPQHSDRIPLR